MFDLQWILQGKGAHQMAAPIFRDEFEKHLEDLFVRSVEDTNSVLDELRVKTVRQTLQKYQQRPIYQANK